MIGKPINWELKAKEWMYKNSAHMFYDLRNVDCKGMTYKDISILLCISEGAIHNQAMKLVDEEKLKLDDLKRR